MFAFWQYIMKTKNKNKLIINQIERVVSDLRRANPIVLKDKSKEFLIIPQKGLLKN